MMRQLNALVLFLVAAPALASDAPRFALDEAMAVGSADAPVVAVEYACPRCPHCKTTTLALHEAVASGSLKGKVRLYFRPFPIRGKEGAAQAALGMVAAARLGKFWPFVTHLYENFNRFAPDRLPDWAVAVGLTRGEFQTMMDAGSTRDTVVAAKKEGLRNGVNATPSLFINGRAYDGKYTPTAMISALQAEHQALTAGKR